MRSLEELPFTIDVINISAWLSKLSQFELTFASNELYKVLKIINKQSFNADDLFLIIDLLTPTTLQFSHNLELLFISISAESHRKSRKLGRLSTNLLRYLALAYVKTAQDETVHDHHTLAISRAFQLAGLSMRHNAMIHERQSKFLWQKMSELYQIGFGKNLLDQPTKETIKELTQHTTITSIIKRNLLFSICNPYNFSSIEINQLFTVIEQNSDLLELKTLYNINTSRADFYWLYLDRTPPQFIQADSTAKTILHINTQDLINFFQSSKFSSPFKDFEKIIYRLSKYQDIIHSVIVAEPLICNLMTGFDQSIDMLTKQDIQRNVLSNRINLNITEDSAFDNLKLEPLAGEQNHTTLETSNIWQNSSSSQNTQIVKVQRAVNKNYCIAEVTKLYCHINEPALLHFRDMKMTLGIIRQIQNQMQQGNNTYRILIEKWQGEISCIKSDSESIILITKKNQPLEVLLPLNKYTSGTTIKTHAGELLLQNLLEENQCFMHFEIILNP